MLGELRPICLWKYVRVALAGTKRWQPYLISFPCETDHCACLCCFLLDSLSESAHNYKDTEETRISFGEPDGNGFKSEQTPTGGLEGSGCHAPAPPGGDRSPVSRQRILRSERPSASQVRDAAQRPKGGTCGGGGGRSLWRVAAGLLCDARVVQARGSAGPAAAQARAEAAPQAQRRSACGLGSGGTGGRTDAQGRGAGGASGAALRRPGASAEHPPEADSLLAAAGKKHR
jgi:hypothetical protein